MSLTKIFATVLRFLAFWFFVQSVLGLVGVVVQGVVHKAYGLLWFYGSYAVYIVLLVLFWFFAEAIARFVTKGIDGEISAGALTRKDCYGVAFVVVGLCFILGSFGRLIAESYFLLQSAAQTGTEHTLARAEMGRLFELFMKVLLGLACIFGAGKWAGWLVSLDDRREQAS